MEEYINDSVHLEDINSAYSVQRWSSLLTPIEPYEEIPSPKRMPLKQLVGKSEREIIEIEMQQAMETIKDTSKPRVC